MAKKQTTYNQSHLDGAVNDVDEMRMWTDPTPERNTDISDGPPSNWHVFSVINHFFFFFTPAHKFRLKTVKHDIFNIFLILIL